MPGESYRRQFSSVFRTSCVFRALTTSLCLSILQITSYKAKTRRKITTKVVAQEKKVVHRAEVTKWEPSLQVPALPPTRLGGCHIIDVRFLFEVCLFVICFYYLPWAVSLYTDTCKNPKAAFINCCRSLHSYVGPGLVGKHGANVHRNHKAY